MALRAAALALVAAPAGEAQQPRAPIDESRYVALGGIEQFVTIRGRDAANPVLLGHSWGSVVGAGMAQRRPDLFAAFVGTGQVGSWDRVVRYQYDFVRAEAEEAGDPSVLDALAALGAFDPRDVSHFLSVNAPLRARLGPADAAGLQTLRERIGEILTPDELEVVSGGMSLSGRTLFATQTQEDLFATAARYALPFIVIQGRDDLFTPTPVAIEYFEAVDAPRRALRVIEGAGHFALVTYAEEFLAALTATLAPCVDARVRPAWRDNCRTERPPCHKPLFRLVLRSWS